MLINILLFFLAGTPQRPHYDDGASSLPVSGGPLTGAGTCSGADSVLFDNNGAAGCSKLTDVAPQGAMLRSQPAFPGGTQTAADTLVCGGQDETTITIDDYTLCEDDTVTITVINSNGTSTATVLTESELGGNDWNAVTSNNQTATNLAAQLNDGTPDGVTATASAAVVRIVLDPDTCIVTLAESDATCTTVSVGTLGDVEVYAASLDMQSGTTARITSTAAYLRLGAAAGTPAIASGAEDIYIGTGTDVEVDSGDVRFLTVQIEGTRVHHNSSVNSQFGTTSVATPEYYMRHQAGGTTQFDFNSDDCDAGGGTDCIVWFVDDGTANFSLRNGEYISNNTNGQLVVGGLGQTNNESITFDFETTANTLEVTSATGVTAVDFNTVDVTTDTLTATSTIVGTAATNIGWSVVVVANQACDTTCTNACVVGFATGTVGSDAERPVACTDATADRCLCAGGS